MDPKGQSWGYEYLTNNNLDYMHIEFVKVISYLSKDIVVPTIYGILKQTVSQLVHQRFGYVSIP